VKTFTSLLISFSLVCENSRVKTFTCIVPRFSSRGETSPLIGESSGVGFGVAVFACVLVAYVWVYAVICQTTPTQNRPTLNNPNNQTKTPYDDILSMELFDIFAAKMLRRSKFWRLLRLNALDFSTCQPHSISIHVNKHTCALNLRNKMLQ